MMSRAESRPTAPLARLLLALLAGYRRWISPLLPAQCRFYPTCSAYAAEAIRVHGPARGGWLALRRLARCHPFHPGGLDPVPPPRSGAPGAERGSGAGRPAQAREKLP